MSLLLDALKKAAEQKAEKSREDIPEATASEETILIGAPEDISELDVTDKQLPKSRRGPQDDTETNDSRLQTQLDDTRVLHDDDDESDFGISDPTDSRLPDLSTQIQTDEDETIVFAEEDISDFLGEPELVNRESQDDTSLSQVTTRDEPTEVRTHIEPGDETPVEDETEFDQTFHQTNIQPDDPDPTSSNTVLDQTSSQEDMSLLLVEQDDTNFTARTSQTDPGVPEDQTERAPDIDADSDDLALIDTTRHRLPDDATETQASTQTSATTGITPYTQSTATRTESTATRTESTATRTESTGTYTYAPDNYDRTLVKLPSEDASRLFAGMKTDSDVVMTPDYAKKVFRSKTSAQRLQHFKFYAGIMIVIVLAIGIYSAFEFQDKSNEIDVSLDPLMRDPMPGIIQAGSKEQTTKIIAQAEPDADARTIEIIKNAGDVTSTGEIATGSAVIEETVVTVEPEVTIAKPKPEAAPVSQPEVQPGPTADTEVASLAESVAQAPESSSSNLQISSTSRVGQKDIWLREAYAAYLSGNNELAMTRYNQVLEEDPRNRNALLARAAINVQTGNSAAALRDYQALLLANPKDSLAMASLIAVGNYSPRDSESQLKLMIRDEPESPYLNFALANVFGSQNRWQEAQGFYFRALQNNPQDPNYAYNLAVSLEHISQPESAMSYYQRALDNFENGLATFSRDVVDQRLELLAKK